MSTRELPPETQDEPGRQIDPKGLVFQSFRHSQGDAVLQTKIFNFVRLAAGVEPDFDLSLDDVNNYVRYLKSAPQNGKHVPVATAVASYQSIVFEQLNLAETSYLESGDRDVTDLEYYAPKVGQRILRQERELVNNAERMSINRFETISPRLLNRLQSEHPSFMWKYGRDGHSTGFQVFDRMYRLGWAGLTDPGKASAESTKMVIEHAAAINEAVEKYSMERAA
jgi:hypothetical protein